jgi:hypothetical protein
MRLKSDIWVAAFLRRCETEGKFGAVLRRGAAEAGAVFVTINHLNGEHSLLSPPPGPAYDDNGDRRFMLDPPRRLSWQEVRDKIDRHAKFDSDLWLVEAEDRDGLAGLTIITEKEF